MRLGACLGDCGQPGQAPPSLQQTRNAMMKKCLKMQH